MAKHPSESRVWADMRQHLSAARRNADGVRPTIKIRLVIASTRLKGTLNQCLGVAQALESMLAPAGISVTSIRLDWRGLLIARLPIPPRWQVPTILLSCGSAGEGRARRFAAAVPGILWAHIERPDTKAPVPDLVFLSRHDWLPADDDDPACTALDGVPHPIRQSDLAARRDAARHELGLGDADRMVAVLIGGENPAFFYSEIVRRRIADDLYTLVESGHQVFVTGSRRTDPALMARLTALQGPGLSVYDGKSVNPYRDYLAAADEIVVSEDSMTMCCEALATGRPVSLLRLEPRPGARLDKFRRFQAHLAEFLGFASDEGRRRMSGRVPDDASRVAERILKALRIDKTSG